MNTNTATTHAPTWHVHMFTYLTWLYNDGMIFSAELDSFVILLATHATHLATPSENTSRADAPATTNLYFLSHDLSANCFGLVYRQIKVLFTRHRLIHVRRQGDN